MHTTQQGSIMRSHLHIHVSVCSCGGFGIEAQCCRSSITSGGPIDNRCGSPKETLVKNCKGCDCQQSRKRKDGHQLPESLRTVENRRSHPILPRLCHN